MRELKFKGISTDTDEVVYGYGMCRVDGRANIFHKQEINLMQATDVYPDSIKQFVINKKGVDYYEGDKVLVQGTKRVGEYETEIISEGYGFTLKENKTYAVDYKCLIAIIKLVEL